MEKSFTCSTLSRRCAMSKCHPWVLIEGVYIFLCTGAEIPQVLFKGQGKKKNPWSCFDLASSSCAAVAFPVLSELTRNNCSTSMGLDGVRSLRGNKTKTLWHVGTALPMGQWAHTSFICGNDCRKARSVIQHTHREPEEKVQRYKYRNIRSWLKGCCCGQSCATSSG